MREGEVDAVSLDARVRDIAVAVFLHHQRDFRLLHVVALDGCHAA